MDFTLSEAQDELAGLVRKILAERDTPERQWADLAAAGVLAAGLPEALGGAGLGLLEQCSVLAEIGRAVSDVPYLASIVLGAGAIAEFGSPEQQRRWAAPAGRGSVVLTAALAEEDGDDPRIPSASATRRNGRWVLSGVKTAVPAAPRADLFLVPAATSDGVTGVPGRAVRRWDHRGAAAADGFRRGRPGRARQRRAGRRPGARAGRAGRPGRRLAGVTGHRGAVRDAGRCHRAGAGTDRGVRAEPGSVRPADRLVPGGDAAAGRRLHRRRSGPAHHVAGRLAAGFGGESDAAALRVGTAVATAKFWAADAGHRVAHTAVHVHGGLGIDMSYPVHRYFVAAKHHEFALGGATAQLRRIGSALAGEPAP